MYCNDGTGLGGTGDWRFPAPSAHDTLGRLRKRLLQMAVSMAVPHRLAAHTATNSDHNLFSDAEIVDLRSAIADFCRASGQPCDALVAPGQPFALILLESLRMIGGFPDSVLIPSLSSGVSTGVLSPLEPSGRWPPSKAGPVLGPCLDW